jgi:hypothetical protein
MCLLVGSVSSQEVPSNYEPLKCYEQLIGTWGYAGQASEEVQGIVERGDPIRLRLRWIVDRNTV